MLNVEGGLCLRFSSFDGEFSSFYGPTPGPRWGPNFGNGFYLLPIYVSTATEVSHKCVSCLLFVPDLNHHLYVFYCSLTGNFPPALTVVAGML
jgi:hypothetical protein